MRRSAARTAIVARLGGGWLSLAGQRRADRFVSSGDWRHRHDAQRERLCRDLPRPTIQARHRPWLSDDTTLMREGQPWARSAGGRADVLVQAEEVGGVVAVLQ